MSGDARPTALSRMSPAIRAALEAAAQRGVDTAAIALGGAPRGKRGKLVAAARPADTEFAIQSAFFAAVDAHPVLHSLPIYAVPNFFGHYGSARQRKVHGARAAQTGRRKGVPDVSIDVARCGAHGLRIEFKVPGNTPQPEQDAWHSMLRREGYLVVVCVAAAAAVALVVDYVAGGRVAAEVDAACVAVQGVRTARRGVRPPRAGTSRK